MPGPPTTGLRPRVPHETRRGAALCSDPHANDVRILAKHRARERPSKAFRSVILHRRLCYEIPAFVMNFPKTPPPPPPPTPLSLLAAERSLFDFVEPEMRGL